jgi:hypothetical protein
VPFALRDENVARSDPNPCGNLNEAPVALDSCGTMCAADDNTNLIVRVHLNPGGTLKKTNRTTH